MSIFRPEALKHRQPNWLGSIVLLRPVSLSLLTTFFVLCAIFMMVFAISFSYTKRVAVSGQLTPYSGVVKVFTPQAGEVLEKNAAEGVFVKKGDVLYVLSSDRSDKLGGSVQESISGSVEKRRISLIDEIGKTRVLQAAENRTVENALEMAERDQEKVSSQIELQRNRVQLAYEAFERSQQLSAKNFISKEHVQIKDGELLDQRNKLQALERDKLNLGKEIQRLKSELVAAPLRNANQIAQLSRMQTAATQELTESEAKRQLFIRAPRDGILTAVTAEIGQNVDGSRPLVSIVPDGSNLVVKLFAPTSAIGFVKPGSSVLLRYHAFPYQKFGHARGKVESVSRTAISATELNALGTTALTGGNSQPIYLITVTIEKQTMTAYGKEEILQAGMLVDADILVDTRKLYEWALEPLLSLTGKL